jgi:hypothetical protein
MLRHLASTRLTILLCLVLAAAAVAGSLLYRGNTAFADRGPFDVFRSPFFLLPAALLAANVTACTILHLRERGNAPLSRLLPFAGLHAGLLVACAGLLADGLLSVTGTRYYPVGVPAADYFDWGAGSDRTFPFRVEVRDFAVAYHPLPLRIGVKGPDGAKHGPFDTREGVALSVPSLGLTVTPGRFDFSTESLPASFALGGATGSVTLRQGAPAPLPGGGEIHLLARYKERDPSGYRVALRFLPPGGAPLVEREARVNRPVAYGGYSFCFTAWRQEGDETLVGLQVTREPGAPWFWGGSLLFLLSLLARLLPRLRRGGAAAAAAAAILLLPALPPAARASEGASPAAPAASPAAGAPAPGQGRTLRWEGEVRVTSVVRIGEGETLSVAPGTTVLLSTEDRDGDGAADGRIEVAKGTFLVSGEAGREVRFLPDAPEGRWDEIFLLEARGRVSHALFSGARYALHVHDGDVRVERSLFRGNGGGARSRGTGLVLDRCDFEGNGVGLRFWEGGPRATRCRFTGNGTALFYRDGGGGGKIEGSVFQGNSEDLRVGDWARGTLDLSGNRFPGGSPAVTDFRDEGMGGEIRFSPLLSEDPPAGRLAP